MDILGISCFYHDSAACLIRDGEILAAAQEERFARNKHDPGFPKNAISYCLKEAGIKGEGLDYVVFYDKPLLTFERLLLSYLTVAPKGNDSQQGSYLGPSFSNEEVKIFFDTKGHLYHGLNAGYRNKIIAEHLAKGKIVGYMSGRMEFGPRALGARSILGDARREDAQEVMNLKIKYRESFRPFAPSVIEEKASEYFDTKKPSQYMLLVAKVKEERRLPQPEADGMQMWSVSK